MASTTQEGTGKHPHKSAAEPHEHHEAPTQTAKGRDHESSSASHTTGSHTTGSTEQGTGKHPHKSAAEPHEHHEAPTQTGKGAASHTESKSHSGSSDSPTTGQSAGDLESRAYTGPDGKEHHHTTKYQEQHKGE